MRRGSGLAVALALLALVAVFAASTVAYLAWQRLAVDAAAHADRAAAMEASIERARAEVRAELRSELEDLSARIEANRAALAGQAGGEESLRKAFAGLERALGQTRETLRAEMRAEIEAALTGAPRPTMEPVDVERLLLIANDALALRHDPDTALEALRTADRRLRALDDPVYAETRRLLAAEIVALENAPRPDIAGMAFRLGGLQEQLRGLTPRMGPAGEWNGAASAETAPSAAGDGQPSWRNFLGDLWDTLRGLVVIRRTGEGEGPLFAPEQRAFLAQNLYLKLEAARLALLAGDTANFHLSVRDARGWLTEYYPAETPAVAGLIAQLDEMGKAELRPRLPDVSGSLIALRAAMERRHASPPPAGGSTADESAVPAP